MNHTIVYSCGHEGTVNLKGPFTGQANRVEWLERHGRCPACNERRMGIDSVTEKINDALVELPFLRGTANQVSWARSIREERIKGIKTHLTYLARDERRLLSSADGDDTRYALNAITRERRAIIALLGVASSSYWINTRKETLGDLLDNFSS